MGHKEDTAFNGRKEAEVIKTCTVHSSDKHNKSLYIEISKCGLWGSGLV